MNNVRRSRLDELKIQASILLKDLRADSPKAIEQFRRLPQFAASTPEEIISQKEDIKRKHALAALALGRGYQSWEQLRNAVILEECLGRPQFGGFLNHWFARYEDARNHHELYGGYLLQYRKDYFVCEQGYIAALGLGELDSEWERIGYDWVKPKDRQAWDILFEKAKKNYLSK